MLRTIGIVFLSTFLASCATFTKAPTPQETALSWKEREAILDQLTSWQLSGKIAVRAPHNSGSASVDWLQNQRHYKLSLFGPLGSQSVTLTGQPGLVTLETADGKRDTASSPESLLAKQLGYHLPVSNLRYWVRGLPAPGASSFTQFDHAKRLTELVQQGWRIRFLGYTRVGQFDLPDKIFINSTNLNVKIIIYNWKLM